MCRCAGAVSTVFEHLRCEPGASEPAGSSRFPRIPAFRPPPQDGLNELMINPRPPSSDTTVTLR